MFSHDRIPGGVGLLVMASKVRRRIVACPLDGERLVPRSSLPRQATSRPPQNSGWLSQRARRRWVLPTAIVLTCGKVSDAIAVATDGIMANMPLATLMSSRAVWRANSFKKQRTPNEQPFRFDPRDRLRGAAGRGDGIRTGTLHCR
jgi:hypothetical protein